MSDAALHDLPPFITGPGETDGLLVFTAIFLVVSILAVGVLFLNIHSLPERIAHKGHKLQFEIVAVLCLLALFSHNHVLWVAALLLAMIDLPDLATPIWNISGALERMAGLKPTVRGAPAPGTSESQAERDDA
jgi:hypothetical protein